MLVDRSSRCSRNAVSYTNEVAWTACENTGIQLTAIQCLLGRGAVAQAVAGGLRDLRAVRGSPVLALGILRQHALQTFHVVGECSRCLDVASCRGDLVIEAVDVRCIAESFGTR